MINTTNSVVTDTTYYTFTDHLGSLALITGEDKAILQENDFDAWGRKRNPTDWTFNSVPTANLFDRGYTGHEHLDIFGLINMNGRMYDPVLGKMLSPDLVVQDPGYSESYNRYTYCFNNPLKYTDPSGYEGEGWSQGVWNSHLVDWKAEGWYNMNAQQRSDWYAGNRGSNAVDAETNPGYGLRGENDLPWYMQGLGEFTSASGETQTNKQLVAEAHNLYNENHPRGSAPKFTPSGAPETNSGPDPYAGIYDYLGSQGSVSASSNQFGGGGIPGIGGPSDLHSGFAGGPGEEEKKKSATESVMPFVMTAAAVDGPLPFGEVIGGGILSIALSIDFYYSYMGDPKDWTYTYEHPSQNPIHFPPTGFDPKNPPNWSGPVRWLIVSKLLYDLHRSSNQQKAPPIIPVPRDNTYVAPKTFLYELR